MKLKQFIRALDEEELDERYTEPYKTHGGSTGRGIVPFIKRKVFRDTEEDAAYQLNKDIQDKSNYNRAEARKKYKKDKSEYSRLEKSDDASEFKEKPYWSEKREKKIADQGGRDYFKYDKLPSFQKRDKPSESDVSHARYLANKESFNYKDAKENSLEIGQRVKEIESKHGVKRYYRDILDREYDTKKSELDLLKIAKKMGFKNVGEFENYTYKSGLNEISRKLKTSIVSLIDSIEMNKKRYKFKSLDTLLQFIKNYGLAENGDDLYNSIPKQLSKMDQSEKLSYIIK